MSNTTIHESNEIKKSRLF